jgi:hypothetical protein
VADPARTRDRRLQIVLGTYAVLVFAALWVGFAVGLVSGGQAFTDAWAWLSGLEPQYRSHHDLAKRAGRNQPRSVDKCILLP